MSTLRYARCAGYSGRTDYHRIGTTPFVLSALRSKAYRSMSGVATAVFRFNQNPFWNFDLPLSITFASSIYIVETHYIVFTQILSALHFDHDQIDDTGVFQATWTGRFDQR